MKSLAIKNWSVDERPREKLSAHGPHVLSDAELLAIIINQGTKDRSAIEVARALLKNSKYDWSILSRKTIKDLQTIPGIGPAKAIRIMATLEIANRKQIRMAENLLQSICSSNDAAQILTPLMRDYPHEIFYVLYLDQKNHIIHKQLMSKGGISSTIVDVRMIMKTALEHMSTSIVLAHNHPSGNLKPSSSDIRLTQQIKNAGQVLNITLLDHIIIGHNDFFSFADEGIL